MLKFLSDKTSDRKLRLFACGCCRQVWKDLPLTPVRRAVEVAERFAEGAATAADLDRAHRRAVAAFTRALHRNISKVMSDPAYAAKVYRLALAANTAHAAPFQVGQLSHLGEDGFFRAFAPRLLRCVAGDVFRPAAVDPNSLAWNDGTAVKLARTIYEDGRWDLMPILGDALDDAMCDNAEMLEHCRGPGPHVRGCWVVDSILGNE